MKTVLGGGAPRDYGGVVSRIVAGELPHPQSGQPVHVPVRLIEIRASLDGAEAELYHAMHGRRRPCIIADEITKEILGNRVRERLRAAGDADEIILQSPHSDMETVEWLRRQTRQAEALVAVGSGTVSDLVKYASFLERKPYSVFATSPMNAYSTGTASITIDGIKKSLPAHNASGVFFDLGILSGCPDRLLSNAFADVVCRTTAQVDWLLSHQILGTAYDELPYLLLAIEEGALFAAAPRLLTREFEVLAALVRTCMLNGLSTALVGTTHSGSMAEHMISHYLDMFSGAAHPGSLHGEQVGVATLSVLTLQQRLLSSNTPPVLSALPPQRGYLQRKFGEEIGNAFNAEIAAKTLDERATDELNRRLQDGWTNFVAPLREVMLAVDEVQAPLEACTAATTAERLGFTSAHYCDAVLHARYIRDRYTILDFAAAAGVLENFVSNGMRV